MQENQKVDVYQAFIGMLVFAQGKIDHKLQSIFALYDLDNSKEMARKELADFIKNSSVGLCKLVGLPQPNSLGVLQFTQDVFNAIDGD